MRRLLHLAIGAVAISCAAPRPVDVGYVAGSDRGYVAAELAAQTWNTTCGVELVRVHRGAGAVALREQEGISDNAYGETTLERPFLNIIGPRVPVSIWFMGGDHALPTLTHEFGHALGLLHEPTGIMRAGIGYDALDPATHNTTIRPGLIRVDVECVDVLGVGQ